MQTIKIRLRSLSIFCLFLLTVAATFSGLTFAAEYPKKPLSLVVGFSAGGGMDTYARALSSVASEFLGQPMVVVNKPGAGQMNAAKFVAGGRPDGYTAFLASEGSFLLMNMIKGTPVDPLEDFKIMGIVGKQISGIFVPKNSPFKTVNDLIKFAREKPGKMRWAHTGRGGLHHVTGVGFLQQNGISAQDVPFKGGAKTRASVTGNQVDFSFMAPFLIKGFESQMRLLAVALNDRDITAKDTPTLKELGIPFTEVTSPATFMVPKNTSDVALEVLNRELEKMATHEDYLAVLAKAGLTPAFLNAEDSMAYLLKLQAELKPIVGYIKESK